MLVTKLDEKLKGSPILEKFEDNSYELTLLGSAALCLVLLIYTIFLHQTNGDFNVYISAAKAFSSGVDPYNTSIGNLGDEIHNFVYLPITLTFFQALLILSNITSLQATQYIFDSVILFLSGFLLLRSSENSDWRYIAVLMIGGFAAPYWLFMNGNIDILSLLIVSSLIYGISEEKEVIYSGLAGLMASIKLFPVAILGLFIFKPGKIKEKAKPIASGFSAFLGVIALNFMIFPELTSSFFGNIEDEKTGEFAFSNWTREGISDGGSSIGNLLGDLIEPLTQNTSIVIAVFGLWTLLVFSTMLIYFVNEKDFASRLSFGIISFLLVLPTEANNSTLVMAIPALYFLSRNYSTREKILVLTMTVVIPNLGIIGYGKILPLPNSEFFSILTFLIIYSMKLSIIGFWAFEFYRKKPEIPSLKEVVSLVYR